MADIKVNLDLSSLNQFLEKFATDIAKDVQKGIEGLTKSTDTFIKEKAQQELHSFRDQYIENLTINQLDTYMWEIVLHKDAAWIEEGRPEPYDMKPGLLGTTRAGKVEPKEIMHGPNKGKKYRIVPMNQNKMPNQMASGRDTSQGPTTNKKGKYIGAGYEMNMKKQVQAHLKKLGISSSQYNKLEKGPNGSPKVGHIASFSLPSHAPGKDSTDLLARVNVYQRQVEILNKKTKKMEKVVQRQVTTFRTVTEDQDGKWIHPPVKAMDAFGRAKTFAESEWASKILPQILGKYQGK